MPLPMIARKHLSLPRTSLRLASLLLALAELPYAIGAVVLGDGVAHRHLGWLVAVGFIGAALSLLALRELHKRLGPPS